MHPYSAGIKGGLAGGVVMAALAALYGLIALRQPLVPDQPARRRRDAGDGARTMRRSSPRSTASRSASRWWLTRVDRRCSSACSTARSCRCCRATRRSVGGLVAPLLWTGLLWASLDVINPLLDARIEWRWFVASQIAFGLVAGVVVARTERIATMQSWPFAVRVGIEAPGMLGDRTRTAPMTAQPLALAGARVCCALVAGCDRLPGKPTEADRPLRPEQVTDFAAALRRELRRLPRRATASSAPAHALNNPVYLALVDDASIARA